MLSPWRFVENQPANGRKDWCERPGLMVHIETGEHYLSPCGAARSTLCGYCAEIKRGDVASIGRSGWTDRPGDQGVFLTLTAPGADVLPWDTDKCTHSAGVKCSGSIGCQCAAVPLAVWHEGLAMAWTHFVTELRRQLPLADVQFMKTYEPQSRKALHVHAMVRIEGVCSRSAFAAAVKLAAERNNFGPQSKSLWVDLSDSRQAARIAGYVSKYSTKCADALQGVQKINRHTGEFRPVGLRSWSASAAWGDRMYTTIAKRSLWAIREAAGAQAQRAPGALDLYQGFYATPGVTSDVPGVHPAAQLV